MVAEGSYGLLYKLAELLGSWDDPYIARVKPVGPYSIELIRQAKRLLEGASFMIVKVAQTLTRHPRYSSESIEYPIDGYDRGDYVAFKGWKPHP